MNLDDQSLQELEKALQDLKIVETPQIEFRLYYAEDGSVLTYTCDHLEGQYIVIDKQTFAEARPDVKVVNGKVISAISNLIISKLKPNSVGVATHPEDISVIADENDKDKVFWKLQVNELK